MSPRKPATRNHHPARRSAASAPRKARKPSRLVIPRVAHHLIAGMDQFQQSAFDMLRSPRLRQAADPRQFPARLLDRYGRNTHGTNALAACRLVEAGAKFARLNFLICVEVANARQRPDWNSGDFFGKRFGRERARE